MRRLLRLKSLDFVSRMATEYSPGLVGRGGVSRSGDFDPLPRVWHHSVGREESCFVPQVSFQKTDFRVEPWLRARGKRKLW